MRQEFFMIIFLGVFVIVYGALNYFVLHKFFSLFSQDKGKVFWILLICLSLSYIVASILEKWKSVFLTRAFYTVSACWIGIVFVAFVTLLIITLVGFFYKFNGFYVGIGTLVFIALLSVYMIINAQTISVKTLNIPANIDNDIKIVQLSDIHVGTINKKAYLEKVVKITNEQKPDIVVITGDLFDGSGPLNEDMIKPLNNINSDVLFITGNHEVYEGLDKVMSLINETKLKNIDNKNYAFKGINFYGISYGEGGNYLKNSLMKLNVNKSQTNILLYHAPTVDANIIDSRGFLLQLAGHTHSGQIWPFTYLVRLANRYVNGLHTSDNDKAYVYVSSGTGTWGPPMRLGSKTEITVVNLRKS